MFIDPIGTMGAEHARDLRRHAPHQRARAHRPGAAFRAFMARGQLGPVDNYRPR